MTCFSYYNTKGVTTCNIQMKHTSKRMKHKVAACAHLLVVVQYRLVDALHGSAARGADGARHGRGTRHETRGRSSATVRGARCRGTSRQVGGAGARDTCGTRQVRCDCVRRKVQGRMPRDEKCATRGGSILSRRTNVLIGALAF
jgi:hypothetical protein